MRIPLLASLRRALILGGLAALAALPSLAVKAAHAETTDAMLDSLQATAFQYFWNEANPANGLIKDRDTAGSPASIAAVGFGLTAICIGVDHGWVSRSDAQARVQTTLQTFWSGPQGPAASGIIGYQGLFYHFLDMNTATRTWDSELSTIDTALLMAGILDAKMYFSTSDPGDVTIRALADSIYRRADWEWARNSTLAIEMGWLPTTGFSTFGGWVGYNEAMILYILALGSPTHPVNSSVYNTWLSGYSWQTQYGQSYIVFPPLFGHQYSQCWLDLRHTRDNYNRFRGISYFENSRRATLAQRSYAIANPGHFTGYSDSLWGLTASDVPSGYNARGAPPAQNDDGTITPTAPISSIAFAPDEVIPVIRNLYTGYKPYLWSPYGFRDAFNLTVGWWDTDVLGIDQGPIIIMIENYRTYRVWTRFMQNTDVLQGLSIAHFLFDVADASPPPAVAMLQQNAPNPFSSRTSIRFELARPGHVTLAMYDLAGRQVATLLDAVRAAGPGAVDFDGRSLPGGVYFYRLITPDGVAMRRCVVLR
jgi:hypothetical protein